MGRCAKGSRTQIGDRSWRERLGNISIHLRMTTHIWYKHAGVETARWRSLVAVSAAANRRLLRRGRAARARSSSRRRVPRVRLEARRSRLGRDERGDDPPRARRPRRPRRRSRRCAARVPRPRRPIDALDGVPQRRSGPARRHVPIGRARARRSSRRRPVADRAPSHAIAATELLNDFFRLCRGELHGQAGAAARAYLERPRLPRRARSTRSTSASFRTELFTKNALEAAGYSELEIAQSGVLADGRWPGRLCGAWRDERGRIGTFWARSLQDSDSSTRYLYLRGASRSALPPYGLSEVLRLPLHDRRELVLVEGLIDVHHLRAHGLPERRCGRRRPRVRLGAHPASAARLRVGRARIRQRRAGREGACTGGRQMSAAPTHAPALRVLEPRLLGRRQGS